MTASPSTPFDDLFARLSQGMSAEGSPPVLHEVGTAADAEHTADDRVVWIPVGLSAVVRTFQQPDGASPDHQAWDWNVSIYGETLARVGELHSLLVGWLDLLIGPEQGAPASTDATAPAIDGTVNVGAWLYPSHTLASAVLTLTEPRAIALTLPAGSLGHPRAIAGAIATALRDAELPITAALTRSGAEAYLRLEGATSPDGTDPATITVADSGAGALLGLAGTSTGTAATQPYRPGYSVGKSQPGPRGGTVDAGGWGLIVPVRLYTPIYSVVWTRAPILDVTSTVYAADDSGEDLAISTP